MKNTVFFFVLYLCTLHAQWQESPPSTYCEAGNYVAKFKIDPPGIYQYRVQLAKSQTSTITPIYEGSPSAQAKIAIEKAFDIWSYLIVSPVEIKIKVKWTSLSGNLLANCSADSMLLRSGSQTLIPVALANSLAGSDLLPNKNDMTMNLNSSIPWYYGTDGETPEDKYDLVATVMHEFCHGLGFCSSFHDCSSSGGYKGCVGINIGQNIIKNFSFDEKLYSFTHQMTTYFPNSSFEMYTAMTSNNVEFQGANALLANDNIFPKLSAPVEYAPGSSLSHFEESAYPPGDINALMTVSGAKGEAGHSPGPIALAMLKDIGWIVNSVIFVSQPTSFTRWTIGTNVVLKWNANSGQSVNINLFKKQSDGTISLERYIGSCASNNGNNSYNWTIPSTLQPGFYKIVITNYDATPSMYAVSEGLFALVSENTLLAPTISPNDGLFTLPLTVTINQIDPTPNVLLYYNIQSLEYGELPDPSPTTATSALSNTQLLSIPYAAPSWIIKAVAYKAGYNSSITTRKVFTVIPGIKINQKDQLGQIFGQPFWWNQNAWQPVTGPLALRNSVNYFKADQGFKVGTQQKFYKWDGTVQTSIAAAKNQNYMTYPVTSTDETINAIFKQSENANIDIRLEDVYTVNGSDYCPIYLKDPWLLDVNTEKGPRNDGTEAVLRPHFAPLNLSASTAFKGVFKDIDPLSNPCYVKSQ